MAFDDYFTAGNSIADAIGEAAKHLTSGQRTVLIGAVAAWIDHAVMAEREACAKVCRDLADVCRKVQGRSSAEMMQAYEYAEADILRRSNANVTGTGKRSLHGSGGQQGSTT